MTLEEAEPSHLKNAEGGEPAPENDDEKNVGETGSVSDAKQEKQESARNDTASRENAELNSNEVEEDSKESDDSDDDDDPETMDIRQRRIQNWKNSPFAVGNVHVNWVDDRGNCCGPNTRQVDNNVCCSAYVCGFLGAGRVGNMAVLAQTTEEYNHVVINEETGERSTSRRKRPRLLWVVGPYWPVNLGLTYPLILVVSFFTGKNRVFRGEQNIAITVTWCIFTGTLIFSLAMVACRNPGILYRRNNRPVNGDDWRWNDQSRTFRPPRARFDPECQIVVEGFDHTCPWTGTAIGSRNMFWFKTFIWSLLICIMYDISLHIFSF